MKQSAIKLFILSGILFLAGICLGSAAVCLAPDELCANLVSPIVSANLPENRIDVILGFAISAIKPLVFMWIFGFTKFSVYANASALGYRGCVLGSIIGALYRSLGVSEGFMLSICSILPQNLPYIFILLVMAVLSFRFSVYRILTKKSIATYFCILAVCIAVCFICGFFDAYITSVFLRG